MPPQAKLTREQILDGALALVRREGIDALNARALAGELGCSTQPIFSNFPSMEALRRELLGRGEALYAAKLQEVLEEKTYPPYKAYGIGYIRFAREEKHLFRWLFMRDRTGEDQSPTGEWTQVAEQIHRSTGMGLEEAGAFHLRMWIFVHGIATMIATGYLDFTEAQASAMLTEVYQAAQTQRERREDHACH